MPLSLSLTQVGLSRHTASLALRGTLAEELDDVVDELARLAAETHSGFIVLSTCHRMECYVTGDTAVADAFASWIANAPGTGAVRAVPAIRRGASALAYLMRIASGLDAVAMGEREIASQLRGAWRHSVERGWSSPLLDRLIPQVLDAAARVRPEAPPSVASIAVQRAAAHHGGTLAGTNVLVVGAGAVARGVVSGLAGHAHARLHVVARRPRDWKPEPLPWDALAPELSQADVVFVTTSASKPTVDADVVRRARETVPGRPLLLIDLAVPRNVAPELAREPGVTLLDLEALGSVGITLPDAERRLSHEVMELLKQIAQRNVASHMPELRAMGNAIARAAAQRLAAEVPALASEESKVEQAVQDAVKQFLFPVGHALRHAAGEQWPPFEGCVNCLGKGGKAPRR